MTLLTCAAGARLGCRSISSSISFYVPLGKPGQAHYQCPGTNCNWPLLPPSAGEGALHAASNSLRLRLASPHLACPFLVADLGPCWHHVVAHARGHGQKQRLGKPQCGVQAGVSGPLWSEPPAGLPGWECGGCTASIRDRSRRLRSLCLAALHGATVCKPPILQRVPYTFSTTCDIWCDNL